MNYLKPFLLGGSIISGAKFISEHVSADYAPLISGMPIGIISSFFILGRSSKDLYYKGYIITSTIILSVLILIHFTLKLYPNVNIDVMSIVAIISWALISFLVIRNMKTFQNLF